MVVSIYNGKAWKSQKYPRPPGVNTHPTPAPPPTELQSGLDRSAWGQGQASVRLHG